MISVTRALVAFDGAAKRRDLLAAGVTRGQLAAGLQSGRVVRARKGWYALATLDVELLRAIRVGGRLGCVSAARHYGWATGEDTGLHVCVLPNSSRLRTPDNPHQRMPHPHSADVTVHWVTRSDDRARLVTSKRETVVQLAHCQSPELAVAAYDSFLHTDPVGSRDLDRWLAELPQHLVAAMASPSRLCHSFLETMGRVRLSRDGIEGRHQVEIPGVGRVDMLIDGWLIVEWDGLEHHGNALAHDEDCRRDAVAASMGYTTLRFTYSLVMFHWYIVVAAVRAALAGIRPLAG